MFKPTLSKKSGVDSRAILLDRFIVMPFVNQRQLILNKIFCSEIFLKLGLFELFVLKC